MSHVSVTIRDASVHAKLEQSSRYPIQSLRKLPQNVISQFSYTKYETCFLLKRSPLGTTIIHASICKCSAGSRTDAAALVHSVSALVAHNVSRTAKGKLLVHVNIRLLVYLIISSVVVIAMLPDPTNEFSHASHHALMTRRGDGSRDTAASSHRYNLCPSWTHHILAVKITVSPVHRTSLVCCKVYCS